MFVATSILRICENPAGVALLEAVSRPLNHGLQFRLSTCAHSKSRILITDPPVQDFAQSVKQQADIVKVIEGYIRLRKAGAQNYSGLCPFHKEKTPSFSVHAVRQFYHCFGCGVSGDVYSFLGKIENVTFPEAVQIVAAGWSR